MQPERTCKDITKGTSAIFWVPLPDEMALWSDDTLEEYINCLKQEADRHWSIDPNESLKYASIIQHIGEALNKPAYIALGLMAQGDALKNLGRVSEAWAVLVSAGEMYQKIEDVVGWARTRIGIVFISIDVDKVSIALDEAMVARRILIEHKWLEKCVFLDMNVATVHHRLGDPQKALETLDGALQMAQSLGEAGAHLLWPIYYNLALAYVEVGQLQEAEHSYQQAVESALEQNQTRNAIMAITSQASLYQMQGRYRKALTLLHQAQDMTTDPQSWNMMLIYRIMAECYLHLNRHYEARELAKQAVAGFLSHGLEHEIARTLVHLATAEANLENYEAALDALTQADIFLAKIAHSIWLSRQHIQRGAIAYKQGDYAEVLRQTEKAMLYAAPGSMTAANALLLQGRVHLSQKQPLQAQRHAQAALKIARANSFIATLYSTYLLLGEIAETQGGVIHAQHCYQAAIATLTRTQQNLTITLRPGFLQDKQDALHALLRLYLRSGKIPDAFLVLEQAKSQILMNYLGNQDSLHWHHAAGAEDKAALLLVELDQLRSEHQWHYNRLYSESPSTTHDLASRTQAAQTLKACEQRIRTITERLYLLNEKAFSLREQSPVSIREIQSRLTQDDLLIAYYNDGSTLRAFTLDQHSIQVHDLPMSASATDRLIDKLQANLDWALGTDPDAPLSQRLTETYQQLSGHLYETLIGSFAERLQNKKKLILVPYGSLHYLAFNTLFDGQSYLIEKYNLIVVPSSSHLTRTPVANTPGIRVLAHSWQQALPFALEEARFIKAINQESTISEVYTEQDAQRSVFAMPPTQVLHIAAHGEYRIDTPEFSYILLDDGQVFIDDVLQHDLRYELITLSGCETGRAKILPGDEPVGLGRAFLYAGAASIIASLWRVDDALTAQLIQCFYQYLFDGASKADALRFAQCDLLHTHRDLHPAYWGALQLLGDSGPLSTIPYSMHDKSRSAL